MDVALGVLEKVPPNTPVTWCARLVIATKANGTPRRTVDLQTGPQLDRHTILEAQTI